MRKHFKRTMYYVINYKGHCIVCFNGSFIYLMFNVYRLHFLFIITNGGAGKNKIIIILTNNVKIITEQNKTLRKKRGIVKAKSTLKPLLTFNFIKPPKPPDITHQQEITLKPFYKFNSNEFEFKWLSCWLLYCGQLIS